MSAGSWYQHFDNCLATLFDKIMDSKIIGEVGLSAARGDLLFLVLVDEQGCFEVPGEEAEDQEESDYFNTCCRLWLRPC